MATIFRKTAKGQSEIETRAARLPPRLRGALILVDGRRSDAEMLRLIPVEPAATLQALVEQGFIEAISISAEAPPRMVPPAAQAAAAPPRPPAGNAGAAPAAGPGSGMPPRQFEALRADLIRSFTDLVGPMAEALALKMERSRSPDELRPLLDVAQKIVANARGSQAAATFGSRVSGSLGH